MKFIKKLSNKNFYPNRDSQFIAFNLTEVLENYKLNENMQVIYGLLSNFIKRPLDLLKIPCCHLIKFKVFQEA
jgi:hypothetical protein